MYTLNKSTSLGAFAYFSCVRFSAKPVHLTKIQSQNFNISLRCDNVPTWYSIFVASEDNYYAIHPFRVDIASTKKQHFQALTLATPEVVRGTRRVS